MSGIAVSGLDEAIAALSYAAGGMNIESIVKANILRAANEAADIARELVPVITGFLRDSIYVEETPDGIAFGAHADYAGFVEFGTSKMQAEPFLRPAVEQTLALITEDLSWLGDVFL
jgi:HK97 gp10 family phage protein